MARKRTSDERRALAVNLEWGLLFFHPDEAERKTVEMRSARAYPGEGPRSQSVRRGDVVDIVASNTDRLAQDPEVDKERAVFSLLGRATFTHATSLTTMEQVQQ